MSSPEMNRLLSSLSQHALGQVMSSAVRVALPLRTKLYSPDEIPPFAYFLTSGLASIVITTEDGNTAEVEIIGSDGVVGAVHLMGPALVSTTGFMQIEGDGIRVRFKHLQELFRSSPEIHDRILEFLQERMLSVSQMAVCNRLHDVESRLARWLLMAQDRTQSDVLKLTQEFLGMMLAARRTTVTLVAGSLQKDGLIAYSRGKVKILDRPSLEKVACGCYQVTKSLQAGLYMAETDDRAYVEV